MLTLIKNSFKKDVTDVIPFDQFSENEHSYFYEVGGYVPRTFFSRAVELAEEVREKWIDKGYDVRVESDKMFSEVKLVMWED